MNVPMYRSVTDARSRPRVWQNTGTAVPLWLDAERLARIRNGAKSLPLMPRRPASHSPSARAGTVCRVNAFWALTWTARNPVKRDERPGR